MQSPGRYLEDRDDDLMVVRQQAREVNANPAYGYGATLSRTDLDSSPQQRTYQY